MHQSVKAFIYKAETHCVAQGKALNQTIANFQQAVALYRGEEHPPACQAAEKKRI